MMLGGIANICERGNGRHTTKLTRSNLLSLPSDRTREGSTRPSSSIFARISNHLEVSITKRVGKGQGDEGLLQSFATRPERENEGRESSVGCLSPRPQTTGTYLISGTSRGYGSGLNWLEICSQLRDASPIDNTRRAQVEAVRNGGILTKIWNRCDTTR